MLKNIYYFLIPIKYNDCDKVQIQKEKAGVNDMCFLSATANLWKNVSF